MHLLKSFIGNTLFLQYIWMEKKLFTYQILSCLALHSLKCKEKQGEGIIGKKFQLFQFLCYCTWTDTLQNSDWHKEGSPWNIKRIIVYRHRAWAASKCLRNTKNVMNKEQGTENDQQTEKVNSKTPILPVPIERFVERVNKI